MKSFSMCKGRNAFKKVRNYGLNDYLEKCNLFGILTSFTFAKVKIVYQRQEKIKKKSFISNRKS